MKLKNIFFLLLLINELTFSQGLLIDEASTKEYQKIHQKNSSFTADNTGIKKSIDFSQYLPSIIDQDTSGTCVGMASAYYLRTILEAKSMGLANKSKIDEIAYSPSYLYNAIKDSTNKDCVAGTSITKALNFMKNKGIVKYKEQGYPYCGNNKSDLKLQPGSRIMDYVKVFELINRTDNVNNLARKALSEGSPLIGLVMLDKNIYKLKFKNTIWARVKAFFGFKLAESEDFRLWKPMDKKNGVAHAICIIGYDDEKYGGAFHIVNSWGKWWGDDGQAWIKYSDFPKVALYCYQGYLKPEISDGVELAASIKILKGTFTTDNEIIGTLNKRKFDSTNIVKYNLDDQPDSTQYAIEANISKLSYIYYIGKNDTNSEIKILFPNADSTSELMGPNTKFKLPRQIWNEQKQHYDSTLITLIKPLGIENWLFLFSSKKINIIEFANKLKAQNGTFEKRIIDVFGKDLVPANQIYYDPKKIGFLLKTKHTGFIVPLLISFNHIEMEKGGFLF